MALIALDWLRRAKLGCFEIYGERLAAAAVCLVCREERWQAQQQQTHIEVPTTTATTMMIATLVDSPVVAPEVKIARALR